MCVCMCVRARVGQGSTLGIVLQVPSTWFYESGAGPGSLSIGACWLASRPKQSACFHLPSAWVTIMNHRVHLFHVHVPSQPVKEDPQQELSQGLKQCWGSQSPNWRKTDFILLNKRGGEEKEGWGEKREGDKEGEARGRKGKGMFECVCYWTNRRNMQNRQRNSIFPRRFLINTNKAWVIFPIKMNAFSKPVHW